MQMVFHHVLPLAMPGMLTGTIIGMARALGESAPLLMIGMVAFIVDIPGGFTDPSTVLPVQIYLWADSPERAFVERTSAATMVLLAFLDHHERPGRFAAQTFRKAVVIVNPEAVQGKLSIQRGKRDRTAAGCGRNKNTMEKETVMKKVFTILTAAAC
jgi:hypothetical protein